MKLRLLIDGRPLVGRRTGIGVHTAEIASRLDLEPAPLIASHHEIADRHALEHCRFRVDNVRPGFVWQQSKLPRVALAEKSELLWGPHGTLPLSLKIRSLATVHDLTSLTMPLKHRWKTIASFNLLIGRSLHQASHIACVSRATADEVMRGFAVDGSKITIVPNGVDRFFSPGEKEEELPFGLEPRSYLFYAGTIEPRKGIADLLTAWEKLNPPLKLILCGDLGWGNIPLLKRIEHHPRRPEIIVSGYLDRRALRALYRHAALFVYPSHYEGFGLPPLEAMACGTPVVTTTGGALKEVAGDAARLVTPGKAGELQREIEKVLRDSTLRSELVERGLQRAAMMTWERSAEAMQGAIAAAMK